MFLALRSLKGGRGLSSGWLQEAKVERTTLRLEIGEKHSVVEDKWALKIGYCDSCGDIMYITNSVAKWLYQMLYKRFR